MKYTLLFLVFLFVENLSAQYNYPPTRTENISDDYFGTKIADPYRWLENMNNTEVKNWFKTQADFTNSYLEKIHGRDQLFNRMKEISEMGGDRYTSYQEYGDFYYYSITKKGENFSKLYRKNSKTGKEEMFFDSQTYKKGSKLNDYKVDEQNKLLMLKIQDEGSELCEIIFIRLRDHQILDEKIYPIWSEFVAEFSTDGKFVTYTKMSTSDLKSNSLLKNMKLMLHKIGTDPKQDKILASTENNPELAILPEKFAMGQFSTDFKYYFLTIASTSNDLINYYVPANEIYSEKLNWKPLIKEDDAITQFVTVGDQIYFLTYKNAPNYKLGITNIQNPDFENAKWILPESEKTIGYIEPGNNALIISVGNGITQEILYYDIKQKSLAELPFPTGINFAYSPNPRKSNKLIDFNTGWLSPYTIYEYNITSNKLEKSTWMNQSNGYPDFEKLYTINEIEILGHDSVMIPLSIIYAKNIKFDGKNPCFITGYGGYGISMRPGFSETLLAFLEKDGVFAMTHVRGGGEKGEKWHQDGMKDMKPNTWKDFISSAEYLLKEKYTSPEKLIGMGTSMGGVLIGGAITERPDLFAVGIANVGMTQVLRNETTSNGDNQIPEVGSVKNKEDIAALIEMDVQSKIKKGVKYPATLVLTGINDSRVVPWMPAKFAAALQANSISGKPVFLEVNYNAGHGSNDKFDHFKMYADIFAFGLWQTGHPEFQPK